MSAQGIFDFLLIYTESKLDVTPEIANKTP